MSYKFNPLTGQLDYFESGAGVTYATDDKTVDAAFLLDKKITLSGSPLLNSELVFLNGLLMGKDCYTVVINEIIFTPTLPFKAGHYIDIRYAV